MAFSKTTEYPVRQRQLNEDIRSGTFRPCYLIYGEEAYLRLQNRNRLKEAMLGDADAMNLTRYEGKDADTEEIIDMADTMPFFAPRRVLLVEDSGFFKTGNDRLGEYLKRQPDTAYFIFVETEVDKRKGLYKLVRERGLDVECDRQGEETLKKWIAKRLRAEGRAISPAALECMLGRVGTDMSNIAGEIDKLISYTEGRTQVTETDIDDVCAGWLSGQIFAMTDAIAGGERQRAMRLYYDLLALKEPPAKILALIARQFHILLQVKEMDARRSTAEELMRATKLPRFVITKYLRWASAYSEERLKSELEICVECEEAVKTGRLDPTISVEMVIVQCSAPL